MQNLSLEGCQANQPIQDVAISITAILSSKSPFLVSDGRTTNSRSAFSRADSDLLLIYNAYLAWQNACRRQLEQSFCRKNSLSHQVLSQIEDQKVQLLVYLVDAGLLQLDDVEKSSLRKARTSSRRAEFFPVPQRYSLSGDSDAAICSVIAVAFYPKLLVREGKGWRNVATNQHVSLAPHSINRLTVKPPKWMSFYQAAQTKTGNSNVSETTAVPECAIMILLGDAEFKLFAGVIAIDGGRIRFAVSDWRSMIALKVLREKMQRSLSNHFRNPTRAVLPADQKWFNYWLSIVQAGPGSLALHET